jgi:hypothetical protein
MSEYPRIQVRQLRQQVRKSEYEVDSRAVAEAIVRRRWAVAVAAKPAKTRVIPSSDWASVHALAA